MSDSDTDTKSKRSEYCDDYKHDEYKLGERLGSGSFGITYLATKRGEPGNFVLKELMIKDPSQPRLGGVSLEEIHSEISMLKKIADSKCRKDLLCYRDHFIDCSNPEHIKMIIVTDAFVNSITLAKFIDKQVLDIPDILKDQYLQLIDKRDDLTEKIEEIQETLEEDEPDNSDELEKRIVLLKDKLKKLDVSIARKKDQMENTEVTPLSHKILLRIMHNILKAMYNLHKLGIGHGDIKPDNILINPDTYDIQIIDFGLACTDQCKTKGTLIYNSPEVLQNLDQISSVKRIQKSDVFSLGIVFFRLANGTFPYPNELLRDIRTIVYPLIEFYKGSPQNIYSTYNGRRYEIDVKINDFIELFFEKEDDRPSFRDLLITLENIIDYYNYTVRETKSPTTPIMEIERLEGSPIKYTPGIGMFPSPTSPVKQSQFGGFDKKTAKYPRKWSKEYCKRTSCDHMGFSQRSSCRYYKNCYK